MRADNAASTTVIGIFRGVYALALTVSETGRADALTSLTDLVRPADKATLAAVFDIHIGVYACARATAGLSAAGIAALVCT